MFRKIINILIAFSFILLIGCAQSSKIDKSEVVDISQTLDRTKPPTPEEPKDVIFPKFKEAKLSNGLEVIIVEDDANPIISISIISKGGSYYDGDKIGLSSITSAMLNKGTTTRTAMQIANELDFLGSTLSSYTTSLSNYIGISTLKKNLNQTLDVFADCILNSTFAEDELQRVITQRIATLRRNKTNPNSLADIEFTKIIFGEHPFGNQVSGTEITLNALTVSDLKTFYSKYVIPNNSYCMVSGDITLDEVVALLEEKLKDWKPAESHLIDKDDAEFPATRRVVVVDRTGAVQSAIRVGFASTNMARANTDNLKLNILNTYLGGFFGSRLNQKLREEKSYTYGAGSSIDARLFSGVFTASTQVGSEFTAPAVEDILDEIDKLSTTPIPEDKFKNVKDYVIGSFPIGIETSSRVANLLSDLKLYGLPLNYYDTYISSIKNMTVKDMQEMAQKHIDASKLVIVISGDSKIIAPTLEKFGNVEIVDADGNPIE